MEPEYLVALVCTDGGLVKIDVLKTGPLEHWLVPEWFESGDRKFQTPARAIRLEGLAHQHAGPGLVDITVNTPIPTAVLEGQSRQIEGREIEVLEGASPRFGKLPIPSHQ